MKTLLLFFLLVISIPAYSCTNLSGSFKTSDNQMYRISQTSCDNIDLIDDVRVFKILFNQTQQLIYDFDLMNDDQVIGRHKVYITSRIESDKWVYDEVATSLFNDGSIIEKLSWSEVFLDAERNLVTIVHRDNGAIETYVDIRQP